MDPDVFILGTGVEVADATVNGQKAAWQAATAMFYARLDADNAAGPAALDVQVRQNNSRGAAMAA